MSITPESIQNFVAQAYQTLDSLNLSIEMLIGISIVVSISFILALREVAAWFFKIDDLKKDIRSLESGVEKLEAEIKMLREREQSPEPVLHKVSEPMPTLSLRRAEQFPINH